VGQVATTARQLATTDLPAFLGVTNALAAGDLTQTFAVTAQPVQVTSRDEIGQMGTAFNQVIAGLDEAAGAFATMRAQLSTLVGEVQRSATHLAATFPISWARLPARPARRWERS
jgi:methyl-accepting chemotaxis protein